MTAISGEIVFENTINHPTSFLHTAKYLPVMISLLENLNTLFYFHTKQKTDQINLSLS